MFSFSILFLHQTNQWWYHLCKMFSYRFRLHRANISAILQTQIILNGNPWNNTAPDFSLPVELQTKQSLLTKNETMQSFWYCCKCFILKQLAEFVLNQLISSLCICLSVKSTLRMTWLQKNCVLHSKKAEARPPNSVMIS